MTTRISELQGTKVRVPKKPKKGKQNEPVEKTSKLGKIHMAVFSPDSSRIEGFLVKRPDIAGMVSRKDVFLAWDSFKHVDGEKYVLVTRVDDGMDDAARKRLRIDWNACMMWSGMDAKTIDGKDLGYVNDAEIDLETGKVLRYFVGDGGVSRALVGSFEINPSLIRGYSKGCMIVDATENELKLNGGLAAKAGEGYARAKAGVSEAGEKGSAAASEAVDKGAFALGRVLGKAKRAIDAATADDDEPEVAQAPVAPALDVQVSPPVEKLRPSEEERAAAPEPKTYVPVGDVNEQAVPAAEDVPATEVSAAQGTPAAQGASVTPETIEEGAPAHEPESASSAGSAATAKAPKATSAKASASNAGSSSASASRASTSSSSAKKKPATDVDKAARAVGKQLGRMGKMFSDFKDEYDKASK